MAHKFVTRSETQNPIWHRITPDRNWWWTLCGREATLYDRRTKRLGPKARRCVKCERVAAGD